MSVFSWGECGKEILRSDYENGEGNLVFWQKWEKRNVTLKFKNIKINVELGFYLPNIDEDMKCISLAHKMNCSCNLSDEPSSR